MDRNALLKLMEKKKSGAGLDPEFKKAKMGVLGDLHSEMGRLMGEDVKGLKKVTVASPDSSGLAEGLDTAKSLLGAKGDEGSDAEEAMESPEEEKAEDIMGDMGDEHSEDEEKDPTEMNPTELEMKIKELQALLQAKTSKY